MPAFESPIVALVRGKILRGGHLCVNTTRSAMVAFRRSYCGLTFAHVPQRMSGFAQKSLWNEEILNGGC
jgi:hypothetical protein